METFSICDARGFHFIPTQTIADLVGADEPGVRFLLTILAGIPLSLIYNLVVSVWAKENFVVKHLYCGICGLLLGYFCFGVAVVNLIFLTVVTYGIIYFIGGSLLCVILVFLFNTLFHLYVTSTCITGDSYAADITHPECVLCLKAISLAWDLFDGTRDKENLTEDEKSSFMISRPTFLETFGFIFFFGANTAGPQFCIRRYIDLVENRLVDEEAEKRGQSRYAAAIDSFVKGSFFLVLTMVCQRRFSLFHFHQPSFKHLSLPVQFCHAVMWINAISYKYYTIWYFTGCSVILSGLSFSREASSGNASWDTLNNVDGKKFFLGYTIQDILTCCSATTNHWMSKYLYRRLKFLGSRVVSLFLTLMYLALWHGPTFGYFLGFFNEFLLLVLCRRLIEIGTMIFGPFQLLPWHIKIFALTFMHIHKWIFFTMLMMPVTLVTYKNIKTVLQLKIFIGFYVFIALLAIAVIAGSLLVRRKTQFVGPVDEKHKKEE